MYTSIYVFMYEFLQQNNKMDINGYKMDIQQILTIVYCTLTDTRAHMPKQLLYTHILSLKLNWAIMHIRDIFKQ